MSKRNKTGKGKSLKSGSHPSRHVRDDDYAVQIDYSSESFGNNQTTLMNDTGKSSTKSARRSRR